MLHHIKLLLFVRSQDFSPLFTNHTFITTLTLGLSLLLTPVAIAGFAPKNRIPASDYTRSAGRRGCPGDTIPLTVLAPQTYIGYTASLRPTFVGFVSIPQTVKFRIFELIPDNKPQQLGEAIQKNVTPGIFQISLPESTSDLTVGKKYVWQLTIKCRRTHTHQEAEFVVVEMPSTVESKLSTTPDGWQKANIYAQADLWYEALAEALKSANNGKLGDFGSTLVKDLAEYESTIPKEQQTSVEKRVQYLKTIAIQEKD